MSRRLVRMRDSLRTGSEMVAKAGSGSRENLVCVTRRVSHQFVVNCPSAVGLEVPLYARTPTT
jgi:hypothetical protein